MWRKGQDDWTSYLHSHFDQIRYLHFRQDAYKPILKNLNERYSEAGHIRHRT